jgi:TorA maturation chaperone TorD
MSDLAQGSAQVAFRTYVAAEDHARANFYALISRLFAAPPDAALLKAIASAPPLATEDDGAPLPLAWSKLIAASSVIDEDAVAEEFESLFGGVGRSSVNLHASHHLAGFMMEKPLAELRDAFATLGLSRLTTQSLTEDHIASVCEVMRILIVGTEQRAPADVAAQRNFFIDHIGSWAEKLEVSICEQAFANYYRVVAQLAGEFLRVEQMSFEIR